MISILGMMLPTLISGSIVVEKVFGIPGMGLLCYEAILYRDYPVIMAVVTLAALLTLFGLLLSDILYILADPRVAPGVKR
jgi:peptide/nickel transport system permease protein